MQNNDVMKALADLNGLEGEAISSSYFSGRYQIIFVVKTCISSISLDKIQYDCLDKTLDLSRQHFAECFFKTLRNCKIDDSLEDLKKHGY